MSEDVDRARMLMEVGRYEEAARELTHVLAEDPEDPAALVLLAVNSAALEQWQGALEAARKAVALAPDLAATHRVLGSILLDAGRTKEALSSAREARRLDPDDADNHALVAACFIHQQRWKEVLHSARRGLALEPDHVDCLNLRAEALRILGRTDEARGSLDVALSADPEDPVTHTAVGYARLQEGEVHSALEHFREALRLDPMFDRARVGLAEALKARNPLYRPILWWMLFSSRFNRRQSILVVVGLLVGAQLLVKVLAAVPWLGLVSLAVMVAYTLLVWTSWVGENLFDLLLWLRRDTRDLLRSRDRRAALCVGGAILAALLTAGVHLALSNLVEALLSFAAFMAVAVPIAGAFSLQNQRARWVGAIMAGVLASAAVLGTLMAGYDAEQPYVKGEEQSLAGLGMLAIALVGSLVASWVLIGLRMLRPRPLA